MSWRRRVLVLLVPVLVLAGCSVPPPGSIDGVEDLRLRTLRAARTSLETITGELGQPLPRARGELNGHGSDYTEDHVVVTYTVSSTIELAAGTTPPTPEEVTAAVESAGFLIDPDDVSTRAGTGSAQSVHVVAESEEASLRLALGAFPRDDKFRITFSLITTDRVEITRKDYDTIVDVIREADADLSW